MKNVLLTIILFAVSTVVSAAPARPTALGFGIVSTSSIARDDSKPLTTNISVADSFVISRNYHWVDNFDAFVAWETAKENAVNPLTFPAYKGWQFDGVGKTSFYDVNIHNLIVGDTYELIQSDGKVESIAGSNANTNGVFTLYDITTPNPASNAVSSGTLYGTTTGGYVDFVAKASNEHLLLAAPEIDKDKGLMALALLAGILMLFAERKKEYTV